MKNLAIEEISKVKNLSIAKASNTSLAIDYAFSLFIFFFFFARKEKENRTKRIKKMAWKSLTKTLERRVGRTIKLTDISCAFHILAFMEVACPPTFRLWVLVSCL